MDIGDLLRKGVEVGCSDLHLSAGMPPMMRIDGEMQRIIVKYLYEKTMKNETASTGELLDIAKSSSIKLTSAPTIHYTMLIPLIIMLIGMIIFSLISCGIKSDPIAPKEEKNFDS